VSLAVPDKPRHIVFVSRHLRGESLRGARAITTLDNTRLLGICEQLPDVDSSQAFADVFQVADAHNSDQLIAAARRLGEKHGGLERIVTATETLLEPVARAGEALGLQGMSVATVRRVLDKSSLKAVLERAGINTARDRVVTSNDDAERFVSEVGFPIILKPLNGSGGLATWCIRNDKQLELALELTQPALDKALLAEEYLRGQELCIDTITVANEPRFYSICYYRPSILEALENPAIQWSCIMPRDAGGDPYEGFIEQGLAAVRALSVGDAITHMEGFLLEERGFCFTDATLRPAGARIGPMLGFACDMDPYRAWARAAVDKSFDGPWERKFAVGTVFLRGLGHGVVARVDGIETIKQAIGDLLVEGRLPLVGAFRSLTYTGDGYITVRHPATTVVAEALDFIAQTIRIAYSDPEPPPSPHGMKEQWGERLQYFARQLNKPAWDNDSLQAIGKD
jgi:hypothetical protein